MLTDFGLSRAEIYSLINLRTTMYNVPKGTAPFMAYELLEFIGSDGTVEIKCTKATDMWAFGMLVYVRLASFSLNHSEFLTIRTE